MKIAINCTNSLNVNRFISLLIFFLVWCLACNSVSITSLAIFEWSFLLPCFIESFTSAKVGIMFSHLHVFMKWISASVFISRVWRSPNICVTIKVSCPCFKYVKKKHGEDTLIVTRTLEDLKTQLMKTEADIHFIKTCKRENIIPTFAEVKLSIKHGNKKLHSKTARLIMETEL